MPKDVAKKSKKMRGGAPLTMNYKDIQLQQINVNTDVIEESLLRQAIGTPNTKGEDDELILGTGLMGAIDAFNAADGSGKTQAKLLEVIDKLKDVITNLPEAVEGGSRKKKSSSKKVKRVGGNVDSSKLYNVSGLIVDSKDPVAVAGRIGPDSTPMPFSANGQGLRYTGGIPTEFMNDLNPSLGQQGGAKKKGKGKK